MNILQTILKTFTRMKAYVLLFFTGPALLAQETVADSDTVATRSTDKWYDQGWLWFVIIIVAIILILVFTRKSDKGSIGSNRYKDKR